MNSLLKVLVFGFVTYCVLAGLAFLYVRSHPFSFPGPGLSDFSAHLAGDYSIHRNNALDIAISPNSYDTSTPVIPSLVVECATDGRFIIAKRNGLKRRSPNDPKDTFEDRDPDVVDYWILDSKQPHVDGPLTEEDFIRLRRSLGIDESIVLRNVYTFRPAAPNASSSGRKSEDTSKSSQSE